MQIIFLEEEQRQPDMDGFGLSSSRNGARQLDSDADVCMNRPDVHVDVDVHVHVHVDVDSADSSERTGLRGSPRGLTPIKSDDYSFFLIF